MDAATWEAMLGGDGSLERVAAEPPPGEPSSDDVLAAEDHALSNGSDVGTGKAPPTKDPFRDPRLLPLGGGYPQLYPVTEILSAWNPDITSIPRHYGRYSSLRIFDFESEAEEAEAYRQMEVPFVVRGVPSIDAASGKWAHDDYVTEKSGTYPMPTDYAYTTHFMYFNIELASKTPGYVPPTRETHLTMERFLEHAAEGARATREEEEAQVPSSWAAPPEVQAPGWGLNRMEPHQRLIGPAGGGDEREVLYGRTIAEMLGGGDAAGSADAAPPTSFGAEPLQRSMRLMYYPRLYAAIEAGHLVDTDWLTADVDIYKPAKSLFVPDPMQQKGVQCRLGMPRIIAEAHFDTGRNFITMVRGRKRYVLLPPDACQHLHLLKEGPSSRHSDLDWTNPSHVAMLEGASGLEVVLEPGEILYIPPFWFHFIVSLTTNFQCNSRAGTPAIGADPLIECGFGFPVTEPLGKHTTIIPPLHHLVQMATGGRVFDDDHPPSASVVMDVLEAVRIDEDHHDEEYMRALYASMEEKPMAQAAERAARVKASGVEEFSSNDDDDGPITGNESDDIASGGRKPATKLFAREQPGCQKKFQLEGLKDIPWAVEGHRLEQDAARLREVWGDRPLAKTT